MWGHLGAVGVTKERADSKAFSQSCGRMILREGENTDAQGDSFPFTRSQRIFAAMAFVIPHLLNPVTVYTLGVAFEYCPT